jgi:hypothetical protein
VFRQVSCVFSFLLFCSCFSFKPPKADHAYF